MFNRNKVINNEAKRVLRSVPTYGLLADNALYFEETIPAISRDALRGRGSKQLDRVDPVFLGPDNGFEARSAKPRTLPKYALYEEAIAYHEAGKIVVAIQFARQCQPEARAQKVRRVLYDGAGYSCELPVLRARVAPNILFFFLAPAERVSSLTTALTSFVAMSEGKAELIWWAGAKNRLTA
ncbi:MAG: hypothetical protein EOM37_06340 [Proteobacteria bacterium]|nr:hypothetical protein [Alphaproteobacteria bacterium]NCC03649.1 hypothetical protein [Pseudomonadota bacterium]